ncbi:MAG: hypothetical protein V8Q95_01205 [Collinsella sp.]|uniref:hypothetical protein n=1 Tax=Collinsella aerofaciens TaxID=74426 RepID=UPI0006DD11DC|nr:hypothetical protein [Collinsella aerofaciens]
MVIAKAITSMSLNGARLYCLKRVFTTDKLNDIVAFQRIGYSAKVRTPMCALACLQYFIWRNVENGSQITAVPNQHLLLFVPTLIESGLLILGYNIT